MADKQVYPMISEKNWWDLRNQFKKTIPTSVNTSYVKSLLGFKSDDSARNNIIIPLRQIGLIDDDGKPTPLATDWRSDEKYSMACQTMLKAIYPPELLDLFPDESVDLSRVRSWFMDTASLGLSGAGKVANTFILIKDAKIKQVPTGSKKEVVKKPVKKTPSVNTDKPAFTDSPNPQALSRDTQFTLPSPTMHIDVQIHISPDASPEQIDKIFESMAKHLYGRK